MKLSEVFKNEIDYIVNDTVANIVRDTLDASPECIQIIPAASSGKYHPVYALGEGGLVRHIKAATGIAHSLIETKNFRNIALGIGADEETVAIYKDIAYAALILHDCQKPDDTPKHHTVFDHPLKAAKLFKECAKKYITKDNMEYMKVVIPLIYSCIASHMGEFCTASYSKGVVLPTPQLGIEHFVYLCDYLASRKFLLFDFDIYAQEKR